MAHRQEHTECVEHRHGLRDDAEAGYRVGRCAHRGTRVMVVEHVYDHCPDSPVVVYLRAMSKSGLKTDG